MSDRNSSHKSSARSNDNEKSPHYDIKERYGNDLSPFGKSIFIASHIIINVVHL